MIRVLDLEPNQIKTLADLEKEIHRQIGVRVVIRRPGNIRITNGKAVAALLNRDLDIRAEGLKLAQFRESIVEALYGNLGHGPKRERTIVYKPDVVIVSPEGMTPNGNTLVENVRFFKEQ